MNSYQHPKWTIINSNKKLQPFQNSPTSITIAKNNAEIALTLKVCRSSAINDA